MMMGVTVILCLGEHFWVEEHQQDEEERKFETSEELTRRFSSRKPCGNPMGSLFHLYLTLIQII